MTDNLDMKPVVKGNMDFELKEYNNITDRRITIAHPPSSTLKFFGKDKRHLTFSVVQCHLDISAHANAKC